MSDIVHYSTNDNIAVINMDSTPINALGLALRTAIKNSFEQALNDDSIDAIVICSSCVVFCGGADISEFGTERSFAEPFLPQLCNDIEKSTKPVIAAINGQALGGGLELALSADYRIALPRAKVGLPEVSLGILPGAGGTQRLPRIANVEVATTMITSGKPISAKDALNAGIVDKIHDGGGDFINAAMDYAKDLVKSQAPVKTCAEMNVDTSNVTDTFFSDFRQAIAAKTRGFFAPERCIQAVEAACELPLSEGLKKEQQLFAECLDTPQARALQHSFFAQRQATKIPGVSKSTPIRDIQKVAIIGSGTMGGGIAMNFANAGIETTILDLNAQALEHGLGVVRNNYEISVKRGRLSQEQVEQRMSLLSGTTSYDDLGEVDLVIEAVFEKMEVKKAVFTELDRVCKPGAILASNTSTLNVDEIAACTNRPQDVIGLHFFSPANVMQLLEMVRAKETSPEVIASCLTMAKRIKKISVVVGVCFGFVGNRMLEPYSREASRLLIEGATPEQVDNVLTEFGFSMGVLSMYDLAGIDVGYLIRESRRDELAHDPSYQLISDKLYELGRYGQKTKRGFYIYEGREKHNDDEVVKLAEQLANELGIKRREISDQEILERCVYMLINEGAKILEEGIAYRSGDCDITYLYGYGFPVFRGGPMQYADEIGLDTVLNAVNKYREQLGEYGEMWFKPASLLEKLVAEGKRFSQYSNL
jgi:3-hydroxyacyl-CoA dehydrogenase